MKLKIILVEIERNLVKIKKILVKMEEILVKLQKILVKIAKSQWAGKWSDAYKRLQLSSAGENFPSTSEVITEKRWKPITVIAFTIRTVWL